tara:strand:+ start:8381 stop:8725 length:345 start_codon:yes stop_codon:yes gene_type:complete
MTEKELKDEIKRLKEKLKKKSKRVSELLVKLKACEKRREYWYNELDKERDRYWAIRHNFPEKYYRVQWSGISKEGNRLSPVTELRTGICAKMVIDDLQRRYTDAKIHMIEEVAT